MSARIRLGNKIFVQDKNGVFKEVTTQASGRTVSNTPVPTKDDLQDSEISTLEISSHKHANRSILEKLSESNGTLQYNGQPIASGGSGGTAGISGTFIISDGSIGAKKYTITVENGLIVSIEELV